MKKSSQGFTILTICVISILLILTLVIRFNFNVNNELNTSVTKLLSDTANQQQLSIHREFDNTKTIIANLANSLSVIGDNEESVLKFMKNAEKDFSFANLIVVDSQGVGILSSNTLINVSNSLYFEDSLNGDIIITEPYVSSFTNKMVYAVSAPINYDGRIEGVVAAEYSVDYIKSLLVSSIQTTDLYNSKEIRYAIILDSNGKAILSSVDDLEIASSVDSDPTEDIVNIMTSGESGSLTFVANNITRLAEYRPLNINEWTLVFVSNENIENASARSISNEMMLINFVVFTILALFSAYIIRLRNKHYDEIVQIAYYDELTGLPNLVKFKIDATNLLKKHPNTKFTIIKMDIVNFKAINEMFDFEVGNEVLKAVAYTASHIDESTFILARTSSDEFMMMAGNGFFDDFIGITHKYEELFKTLIPTLNSHQFNFRYGRYFIEDGEDDINEIISRTNMAHSFAKKEAVTNVYDYDDKIKQLLLKQTAITNKMKAALANEEFKVFLQPKYRIDDSKVIGAEALVRWIEKDGNIIFPNDFIPLFESNGYIVELDKYMFNAVCCLLKKWENEGKSPIPVAVNFSRINITNRGFSEQLVKVLDSYELPRHLIEIELTETTITENEAELIVILEELHNLGFTVSIDDFGSGYSSLGMLKNFKVDTLKLDRSFLLNNNDDRGNLVIDGIIKLAHNLNMVTIAEGVEEENQVDFLKNVNCEAAQGYFYAKPMPVDEFEKMLD